VWRTRGNPGAPGGGAPLIIPGGGALIPGGGPIGGGPVGGIPLPIGICGGAPGHSRHHSWRRTHESGGGAPLPGIPERMAEEPAGTPLPCGA